MSLPHAETKRFDWRAVIAMISIVTGVGFIAGSWSGGVPPETAITNGIWLWMFCAASGALYGHWAGWNG